jgi:hypothetical protein
MMDENELVNNGVDMCRNVAPQQRLSHEAFHLYFKNLKKYTDENKKYFSIIYLYPFSN